jgi:hypothetical protein
MKIFYSLNYVSAPNGESGEILGMKFDLSKGCKICGTGAELVGNLITKGIEKVKKDFFATADHDLIISERLNNVFKAEKIEPQLLQVMNKAGSLLPFYHLKTNQIFPKMLSESKGIQIEERSQCKVCKRDGHFGVLIMYDDYRPNVWAPMEFAYSIDDKSILEKYDIFNTWENFGMSVLRDKKPQFARPITLLSERVRDILESSKVKKITFDQITIT